MAKRSRKAPLLKSSVTRASSRHISDAVPRPRVCPPPMNVLPAIRIHPEGRPEMSMLKVDNVHTYYGNIHALKGITLYIDKGEIVTLIGGNGAGKTTTLRTIS